MLPFYPFFFFFNDTATTEIYTLSLHDALPISPSGSPANARPSSAIASNSGGRECRWLTPMSEERKVKLSYQRRYALRATARVSVAFFPTTMNLPSPTLGKEASPRVSFQTARNRAKQGLSSATVSRPTTFMPRRATRSAASGECTPYHSGGC